MPITIKQSPSHRKGHSFFLAFSWLSGLVVGAAIFLSAEVSCYLWMRRLPEMSVSIVGLLIAAVIPILVSIAAVHLRVTLLLYLIAFVEALQYSFASCWLCQSFGSAYWLLKMLVLFHDVLLMPLLYCYWLRSVHRSQNLLTVRSVFVLSAVCLTGSMEIHIISPFLASLIG